MAEALGTFWLVLIGPGAAAANAWSGGAVTQTGIAVAFFAVLVVTISVLGPISGAHFNPVVTAGLWFTGRFPFRGVFPYWLSQLMGALVAGLLIRAVFGGAAQAAATRPSIPAPAAVAMEAVLTAFLVFVVLRASSGDHIPVLVAGLLVGLTVAGAALVAGPLTGASLNPARSLGPAMATWQWDGHWIYWVGPFLGGALAVGVSQILEEKSRDDGP